MTDVPNPETPVTVVVADGPVVTVATVVVALVHVPPATASLNINVEPAHKVVVPDIAPGAVETVSVTVAVQLVADDVNVIVDVPGVTPDTTPPPAGPGVIVATVVVALFHVPATASVKVVADPAHTVVVPPIAGVAAFTVTVAVAIQPRPVV